MESVRPGPASPLKVDWSLALSAQGVAPVWNSRTGRCYGPRTERVARTNWSLTCPFARTVFTAAESRRFSGLRHQPCKGLVQGGESNRTLTIGQVREQLHRNITRETASRKQEGSSQQATLGHWMELSAAAAGRDQATICEIGLNTGLSAATWLCTFPRARYHSFDLVQYDLTEAAIRWLSVTFGARFAVTRGSTLSTLKRAVDGTLRCDVVSIDGGARERPEHN